MSADLLTGMTAYVQLARPAGTADGQGGQAAAADVPLRPAQAWMALRPDTATEVLQSGQRKPVRRYHGRMRYHPEVTEGTRVTWKGRTFEVVGVVNVQEANRELALALVERTRTTGGLA